MQPGPGLSTEVFGCAGRRKHEGNSKETSFWQGEIRNKPGLVFSSCLLVGSFGDAAWLPRGLGHLLFLDLCYALTIQMKYPLNETK